MKIIKLSVLIAFSVLTAGTVIFAVAIKLFFSLRTIFRRRITNLRDYLYTKINAIGPVEHVMGENYVSDESDPLLRFINGYTD